MESILANATDAFTVLVPTNDAVTAILPLVNLTLDQLQNNTDTELYSAGVVMGTLLYYHILPEGAFTKKQTAGFTSLTPALSLGPFRAAGNLTITAPKGAKGNVTIEGGNNSTATVIVLDIKASKAARKRLGGKDKKFVVHIVDGVLLPPAEVIAYATSVLALNATTLAGLGNTTVALPAAGAANIITPAAGNATLG